MALEYKRKAINGELEIAALQRLTASQDSANRHLTDRLKSAFVREAEANARTTQQQQEQKRTKRALTWARIENWLWRGAAAFLVYTAATR